MRTQARYWREHPPVHLLVAAYVGYDGRAPRNAETRPETVEMLIGFVPEIPAHLKPPIPNPYARH